MTDEKLEGYIGGSLMMIGFFIMILAFIGRSIIIHYYADDNYRQVLKEKEEIFSQSKISYWDANPGPHWPIPIPPLPVYDNEGKRRDAENRLMALEKKIPKTEGFLYAGGFGLFLIAIGFIIIPHGME